MSNPTAMNGGQLTTLNGNTTPQPMRSPSQPSTSSSASTSNSHSIRRNAFVKITEQPASKALRFRYECEGRSAGSIPGVSSTPENKTFPSIQILGYRGRAVVVVSCVTNQPPHKPHPHNLVGKEGCKKGVCTVEINNDAMSVSFSNLGIQCVKKRDIEEALRSREEIRVDPYRTGFQHRNQPSSIDLNSVRLCFQVFLESETRGRFTVPLAPVVSDPIFDKKAMSDLVICKLSCASSSVAGGKEMILLCEKVAKEDIQVRFFEEHDGNLIWESYGDFQHTNVHKQVAIAFRTPRYKTIDVAKSIKCYIQLKRPSDGVTSESLPFEYIPLDSDMGELKRKRTKIDPESILYKQLGNHSPHRHGTNYSHNIMNVQDTSIKTEPADRHSPYPQIYAQTPSPQHNYQPLSPAYNPMNQQHQQQFSPNPPNFANTNTLQPNAYYPPNLHFNHTNNQTDHQMNYMPMQTQQHQPMNQYNISSGPNVFSAPDKPINSTTTPLNIPVDVASAPAARNDSGAINLSGLLDMDGQSYSGEFSNISLSLLEPFQSAGNVEAESSNQPPEENMTDSFTRFTLGQL